MRPDEPPTIEPWMAEAVAAALRHSGCPAATADRLARNITIRRSDPHPGWPEEWLAVLHDHGCGVPVPVDRDEWDVVARHLADNIAADNAEAHDRTARGEAGWVPVWPLPGRRPSRA